MTTGTIAITTAPSPSDVPSWWTEGTPVDMKTTDLVDVEMLEDDEWDLEWRLCRVPVADLHACFADPTYVPLVHMSEESARRLREIAAWIGTRPVEEVLTTAPVFSKLLENRREETGQPYFHFLDGHHRTTFAVRAGATWIPMLVGLDTYEAQMARDDE
jgi:hypothetical protein